MIGIRETAGHVGGDSLRDGERAWCTNPRPAAGFYEFYGITYFCPQSYCAEPFICAPCSATLSVSVGGSPVQQTTVSPAGNTCQLLDIQLTLTAVSSLAIGSGNHQQAPATRTLAQPLVVTVMDGSGNPKSGVPITFFIAAIPPGATGQNLSVSNATTDSAGTASTVLTLGDTAGNYHVAAFCSQCTPGRVTFSETALPFALKFTLRPDHVAPSRLDGKTSGTTTVILHVMDSSDNFLGK